MPIAAVLVLSRTVGLASGFWNDEAYTALVYVDGGPRAIFGAEYVPNNHLLFSLLAWSATSLLGRSEAAYRLWAVVPGIAAVALATAWAFRHLGPWVGVGVALLLTISPVHLELTTQARGYGLGMLAAAAMLAGATARRGARQGKGGVARGDALLAGGGLLGICTLPVMAFPFLGHVAVRAADRRTWRAAIAVAALVGVLALAFWAPLLRQVLDASRQDFGAPVAWSALVTGPYRDLGRPWLELVGLASWPTVPGALFAALAALGARRAWVLGGGRLAAHLVAPVAATYAGLALAGLRSVARFQSFLLPYVAVLLALGASELGVLATRASGSRPGARPGNGHLLRRASRVSRRCQYPDGLLARAGIATCFALAGAFALARVGWLAVQSAATPLEGYREAIGAVRSVATGRVVTNSRFRAGIDYYGADLGIATLPASELEALFCGGVEPLVFLDYPRFGESVDPRCLLARGAERVPIPQRAGAESGGMTVWVLRR